MNQPNQKNFMQVGKQLSCGHCDLKFTEGAKELERLGIECTCVCHNQPKKGWEEEIMRVIAYIPTDSHTTKKESLLKYVDVQLAIQNQVLPIVQSLLHQTEQRVATDCISVVMKHNSPLQAIEDIKHQYNIE